MPQATKVSSTLVDFAQPLFDLDSLADGSTDAAQIERLLTLAVTVWNAVTIDSWSGGRGSDVDLQEVIDGLPSPLDVIAAEMRETRLASLGEHPWAISDVEVVDDGDGGLKVRAKARMSLQ